MKKRFKRMVALIISSVIILAGCGTDKGNGENSFYLVPNAVLATTARTQIASANANFALPTLTAKKTSNKTQKKTSSSTEIIKEDEFEEEEVLEDIQCLDDYLIKVTDVKTEVKELPKTILDEISYHKK